MVLMDLLRTNFLLTFHSSPHTPCLELKVIHLPRHKQPNSRTALTSQLLILKIFDELIRLNKNQN